MGRRVRGAAKKYFGREPADVFFEHGQWWVRLVSTVPDYEDEYYSVVDAVGDDAVNGFGFERI